MKFCTVVGARPQFIKAAALSRTVLLHNQNRDTPFLEEIIIHTGQHYDESMSAVFFEELQIPAPRYNLGIGSGNHGRQTGDMLAGIEEILLEEKPDRVLVYGDTNSTLAGALAAAKLHIDIVHIEAGLRSFNRRMPEEINRVVTDHLSTLLLCPSLTAVNNLAAEGIGRGVLDVGDIMADALHYALSKLERPAKLIERLKLDVKGYILATVHRAENTDDWGRLQGILAAFDNLDKTVLFPVHPRSRKILQGKNYSPPPHVKLIEPVSYFDMIALQQSACTILTDSGGMQKEAYWLQVPCVTLRDETEWIETVESGWNILVGADPKRIAYAIETFIPPAYHPPLFGDGHSATKCLDAIIANTLL